MMCCGYGVWYEVVRRKGKTAKAIRLTAAVSVCLWERYPRAHQQSWQLLPVDVTEKAAAPVDSLPATEEMLITCVL